MVILALDTATRSTVAACLAADGTVVEARDDPPAGERPNHASRLLALAEDVLVGTGAAWEDVNRIAVGVGPGGFTGLRIGVASARALAQARGIPLVAISSLQALALGASHPERAEKTAARSVVAVIDARRKEVFAAAWDPAAAADPAAKPLLAPAAYSPHTLAAAAGALPGPVHAVGDGALLYRDALEAAGIQVAPAGDPVHHVRGGALCRLAAAAPEPATGGDAVLPDYRREPDAVPPARPS